MSNADDLRKSLERLVALGKTPEVNIRPVLLRVLVDLFVRRRHHSPSELAQFAEIVLALLSQADEQTRAIVAEKLARHPATPEVVLLRLMDDADVVAAPILEHAAIDDAARTSAATWGTETRALAVARRTDLDETTVRYLADRPEPEVLLALASNLAAPIDRATLRYLVRRARTDAGLARALLARRSHPADLGPLFLLADAEQRSEILLAVRREDLSPERRRQHLTAEEQAALGKVERTINASEREGLDTALADALGIAVEDVWAILDDPRGEPLAVALAAIGASPELAARLFILSGPAIGHSVMAVRLLTNLVDTLPMRTARRLVAAFASSHPRLSRPAAEPAPAGSSREVAEARRARRVHAVPPRQASGTGSA